MIAIYVTAIALGAFLLGVGLTATHYEKRDEKRRTQIQHDIEQSYTKLLAKCRAADLERRENEKGDKGTRGQGEGDKGTRRQGDTETRGLRY